MKKEFGEIALAGLLHDVGKLGQRAGEIAEGEKDHAAIGNKFVTRYVPKAWQNALAPVGWHHRDPEGHGHETFPVVVVRIADRLSAGERERREDEDKAEKIPQMITPFSRLASPFPGSHRSPNKFGWLPLSLLGLKPQTMFPLTEPLPQSELKRAYEILWQSFCEEADELRRIHENDPDLASYLQSILDLLLRYTWSVPSAFYYDLPDVSLYDHSRTTAALSVCIFAAFHRKEDAAHKLLEALKSEDPQRWPAKPEVAGLVEGDFSGIQNFIYALRHPKGAAAVLRARSFYLQVLTEVIARWILQKLALPVTNILYHGGGRFRLLVPQADLAKIPELHAAINTWLWQVHRGALYLALAGVPLVPAHFAPSEVGWENQAWRAKSGLRVAEEELGRNLSTQKDRRFLELPRGELEQIFKPVSSSELCQICGQEDWQKEEEEIRWGQSCLAFRELGKKLRGTRYIRLEFGWPPPQPSPSQWTELLLALGARLEVFEHLPERPAPNRSVLYLIHDETLTPRSSHEAVARRFLVNVVPQVREREQVPLRENEPPLSPGDVKHFGILARQAEGAKLLGILRMDMDNLGWLMRDGYIARRDGQKESRDQGTFSRKHSLSTLLSLFFEGWVTSIAQKFAASGNTERIYAVYSGGDDLCVVGSWDVVVEFARAVRQDFAQFTGRDDLGISAALVLVHEKYPLYLAAQKAGAALEEAKHMRGEKDVFQFLSFFVPWEEFPAVQSWQERLTKAVEEAAVPRTLLRRLQDLYADYQRGEKTRGKWGPWIWRSAYWLAREAERARKSGKSTALYDELKQALSSEHFGKNVSLVGLAARWAELLTRREE